MTEPVESNAARGNGPPPPFGDVPDQVCQTYQLHLEREINRVMGREPKDLARAAVLLYDLCRVVGHTEEAEYLERIFDRPAIVLYQLSVLLRSLHWSLGDAPKQTFQEATTRTDDLLRLVLVSLEGGDDPSIVTALLDLRGRLQEASDSGRTDGLSYSINHLTQHVNDFFFDRLTALPTLREYVVSVELGLPPVMGPSLREGFPPDPTPRRF